MKDSDILVEVKPNVFLSKHDHGFLRKYLHYNPYDAEKWYEYAQQAKVTGDNKRYKHRLLKAASLNHYEAKVDLQHIKKPIKNVAPSAPSTPKSLIWLFLIASILMLLTLFLLFRTIITNDKYIHQANVEHHYYKTEETFFHNQGPPIVTETPSYTEEDLFLMVMKTAITSYTEAEQGPPFSPEKLTAAPPSNYLTTIPSELIYTKTSSGYSIDIPSHSSLPIQEIPTLAMFFYPEVNQLALGTEDGTILASYLVGSGDGLPFITSEISERVTNPNGGNGVFGTRGLALEQNYAIHGTNDPDSIGKYKSAGCIRMSNEDIETLYPYVSKGTPFIVKEGSPPPAQFIDGLPPFPTSSDTTKEEAPDKVYRWHM
ncbi:L,D-transpeptidase [Pontibacillus yanchengensis]|nr:L,D-transpeptidase [Pontibacillus yanchengensis]